VGSLLTMASVMREVELSILRSCPVRCSYCPQALLREASADIKDKVMDLGTLETVVSNIVEGGLSDVSVWFAGFSEPLRHPDFLSMVQRCDDLPGVAAIWLYTTGEGMEAWMPEALSHVKLLGPINIHASVPAALELEDSSMPHATGSLWPIVDSGLIRKWLPDARFVFVGRPPAVDQDRIADRVGQRCRYVSQVSRAANLRRSGGHSVDSFQMSAVTCKKVSGARRRPVVIPGGSAYACCQDYGLTLPVGNLLDQKWSELDYDEVRAIQGDKSSTGICHTDCHLARRVRRK